MINLLKMVEPRVLEQLMCFVKRRSDHKRTLGFNWLKSSFLSERGLIPTYVVVHRLSDPL